MVSLYKLGSLFAVGSKAKLHRAVRRQKYLSRCRWKAASLHEGMCASQSTQQAMSILNYMVNKETSIDPTLLEGATQENLHDRVGASSTPTPIHVYRLRHTVTTLCSVDLHCVSR